MELFLGPRSPRTCLLSVENIYLQICSSQPDFLVLFFFFSNFLCYIGVPGGSDGKVSACNVGDLGSIPGLGRFPGEGNGNPLQYSCLEDSMDGGAW